MHKTILENVEKQPSKLKTYLTTKFKFFCKIGVNDVDLK